MTGLPGDAVYGLHSGGGKDSLDIQVLRPLCPSVGNLGAEAAGQVPIGTDFFVLLMWLMGARQVTPSSWNPVPSVGSRGQ